MNYRKNFIIAVIAVFVSMAVFSGDTHAQSPGQLLVNEVEFDPPSATSDACQYVEIRAQFPNGVVPANTWFVTVDNSNANPGSVAYAVNLGGTMVGSNGTITIVSAATGVCTGRVYDPGTTLVTAPSTSSPVGLGNASSRAFLLLTSMTPFVAGATNVDQNADGQFDFAVTVIDGFAFNVNSAEEFNYGNTPQIFLDGVDVPDAVTRFPSNSTALAGAAFYWGELAASPDETTTYADPRSPNFPAGGALTPGAPNVPGAAGVTDAPVDINGDGRTDYVVVRPVGGAGSQLTWHTHLNGGGPFAAPAWGVVGDQVIAGDYDGDGRDDPAVFRPAEGAFYIIHTATQTIRADFFGQAGDNARVVGDYDGDGRDDLAVYRPGAQSLWYYKTSPTSPFNLVEWGQTGDVPAPGDYDGDGKADFIVRRTEGESGKFWLRTSSGAFDTVTFGLPTDLIVPGDYDDDGKTDIAVLRTSTGSFVWEFEPSGTAGTTVASDVWGVEGDVVAQGDYDGDGRTDFAVWRPGTQGTFHIMTVSRTVFSFDWGQTGDEPVARYNTF